MERGLPRSSPRLCLGSLLFNIYVNDIFVYLDETEICKFEETEICKFGVKGGNEITIKIGEPLVKENTVENLLGITLDKSLSFKKHATILCRKVSQKLFKQLFLL